MCCLILFAIPSHHLRYAVGVGLLAKEVEKIAIIYKDFSLYNREIIDYIRQISFHRQKFIRKIYKLGIIDFFTFNLFLSTKGKGPRLYCELIELGLFKEKNKYVNTNLGSLLITFF